MSCKKEWDRKVLVNKFDRTFVDKHYKNHREIVLLDKERGLLPATQPHVEKQLLSERLDQKIAFHNKELQALAAKINNLKCEKNELLYKESPVEKKQFIRKCPNGDCRGFLSSQWKCGLCDHYTCSNCNEVRGLSKHDAHECDADTVATVKLLAKDTKSCPGCGTGIFKIAGCDQMFCMQCQTAFSWKTGEIETGSIHNPHFYEYQRKNGVLARNPLDIQCGREMDNNFINALLGLNLHNGRKKLMEIARTIVHVRRVEVQRYAVDRIANNLDIRIHYMMNKLTEDDFKRKLQKREKDMQKKTEISNVLAMFVTCATEIFHRLYQKCKSLKKPVDVTPWLEELDALSKYSNECLESISVVYKCKTYQLPDLN
jgi:hypothetical protein